MNRNDYFNRNRIKSLDYIEDIIQRMASNSFKLKTWTITLVSGITFFLSKSAYNKVSVFSLLIPVIFLGILDIYYLKLEREYRRLYNQARNCNSKYKFYNLSISCEIKKETSFISTLKSPSIYLFYGPLIFLIFIIYMIIE